MSTVSYAQCTLAGLRVQCRDRKQSESGFLMIEGWLVWRRSSTGVKCTDMQVTGRGQDFRTSRLLLYCALENMHGCFV